MAGEWIGLDAERLGLAGKVRAEDFLRLCENQHPATGEMLTQRLNTTRTVGSENAANAYRYMETVVSRPVQQALMSPPYNFVPVNKEVPLGAGLPMRSLDEMARFNTHDWSKINPLRGAWIERFNREMAK